ncbi:DUF4188 domain-containing protein [Halalkalibacillus sediminis]|uniref:DUF4188 domain-containing protein n=1 Tax=Halalkalibacillus sediminis TaxID=2018042 RepID=A0A2I0QR62_9BACI|nr:DUF4188 domain-containing protein [Halalkalibacillus sediminis]PKR76835.1 DUF4188 domain-containing protein [Halalkalibacillus sediminis]
MGSKVYPGRYTVEGEKSITVFIIGMRINKWWAIHKWFPVFLAMPRMIRELYTNDDLGFLSLESFYGFRTTLMVQYWRSEEQLLNYAKAPTHLKAWKDFNRKTKGNDSVGIYHETYNVIGGNYETIYANMPQYGLGKVFNHVPITPSTNSAAKRLKVKS